MSFLVRKTFVLAKGMILLAPPEDLKLLITRFTVVETQILNYSLSKACFILQMRFLRVPFSLPRFINVKFQAEKVGWNDVNFWRGIPNNSRARNSFRLIVQALAFNHSENGGAMKPSSQPRGYVRIGLRPIVNYETD